MPIIINADTSAPLCCSIRPSRSDGETNVPNEGSHTPRSRYAETMEGRSDSTRNLANSKGPDNEVGNF